MTDVGVVKQGGVAHVSALGDPSCVSVARWLWQVQTPTQAREGGRRGGWHIHVKIHRDAYAGSSASLQ